MSALPEVGGVYACMYVPSVAGVGVEDDTMNITNRNFTNEPLRWLRANHPELMTESGAIDGSKGKTAQEVVKRTSQLLVQAGMLGEERGTKMSTADPVR